MFDYSLLGSFALFLVVAFVKIRPAVAQQVDECIKDIRASFDEADERIKALKRELQSLQKHAKRMEETGAMALEEARSEAKMIESSTRQTVKRTRQYYVSLHQSQERYWQERLELYRSQITSAYVFNTLQDYCGRARNAKKVHAVTKVLTQSAR